MKGANPMRRITKASLLASIFLVGSAASPVLYAAEGQESPGSMMGHGMMGHGMTGRGDADHGGGMMGMGRMMRQMSEMMDHCSNMVSGMSGGGRPNEQRQRN
jgi:hypothetical protein